MVDALERVLRDVGGPEVLDALVALPGADLTTLLLEVTRRRAAALSPADVLRRQRGDRFVVPGSVSFGRLRAAEDALLGALPADFEVVVLAPVVPLGTHSVLATVDQNKVLGTIRATEVAADPTNALALIAAERRANRTDAAVRRRPAATAATDDMNPRASAAGDVDPSVGCWGEVRADGRGGVGARGGDRRDATGHGNQRVEVAEHGDQRVEVVGHGDQQGGVAGHGDLRVGIAGDGDQSAAAARDSEQCGAAAGDGEHGGGGVGRDVGWGGASGGGVLRLVGVQRVVRGQWFGGAGAAHFALFCSVIAGRDSGNLGFERGALAELLVVLTEGVRAAGAGSIRVALTVLTPRFAELVAVVRERLTVSVEVDEGRTTGRGYYIGLCFKIFVGNEEVGDGGFVDWLGKLTGNRKERLLIGGVGVDRLAGLLG